MNRYWIARGRHGGLVVTDRESWEFGGWFNDHEEAFERMVEIQNSHDTRRAVVQFLEIIAAVAVFALAVHVVGVV